MGKTKVSYKKKKKLLNKSSIRNNYVRFTLILITLFGISCVFSLFFLYKQPVVCANSISCIKNLTTNVENNAVGTFEGHSVIPPKVDLSLKNSLQSNVLGATTPSGPKHIYVDLTNQTLTAYQGSTVVLQTYISSGKWHPTPDGTFTIWIKLRSTRMTGGSGADYYDLPNVQYVMYFYNNDIPKSEGFALHGAYWHDNFGHTMSHGCVNMRNIDAQALYDWVEPTTIGNQTYATANDPGTQVTISGTPVD